MKTSDIKKIGYTQVDHMLYHSDYNNVVIELTFLGLKFYQPYKRKSIFNHSYRIAKWRIFKNIKKIVKGYYADVLLNRNIRKRILW